MKKLSDWKGNYLCALNSKLTILSDSYVREEPDMFCIVKVEADKVIFPDETSKDLMSFITETVRTKKCLKEVLENFIKSDPDLLKFCKQHRLGYVASIKDEEPKVFPKFNQSQMEKKFILKILIQKKDHKNLQEFKRQLKKKK